MRTEWSDTHRVRRSFRRWYSWLLLLSLVVGKDRSIYTLRPEHRVRDASSVLYSRERTPNIHIAKSSGTEKEQKRAGTKTAK